MHAVVVRVTINDEGERSEEELRSRVVPMVSKAPGFVAGYWTRSGNSGMSMIVFESEETARQMAERVPQNLPDSVTFKDAEVREVVVSA